MAIRLIAGRAGSGKTHHCLSEACRELQRSRVDGPRLVLLVPEQAGLQMERALLSMLTPPSLGRCEVLSFRRLAFRIFSESLGPQPLPMTPTGRQMALRYIIARHARSLREFSKVSDRPGFLTAVASGIVELIQEAVTPDDLDAAATAAESDNDPTSSRLHDMAVIFRAYLEYLGSERVDPEAVLDLARSQVASLKWPDGSRIWIDGFAGLTQQQIRMIIALSGRAMSVDVALLLDPLTRGLGDVELPLDDLSLFARTERTWFTLAQAAQEAGIAVDEPVILGESGLPRFSRAPQLAELERKLFRSFADTGSRTSSVPLSQASVQIVVSPDRRKEVDAAVTAIVDLVQRDESPMRYRDIAIVVRELTPYHDLISSALAERQIPFFIDRRRPTYHHPLVQFVRALTGLIGSAPYGQSILAILKSGLSGLDDDRAAAVENYFLAHGLDRASLWETDWTYPTANRGGSGQGVQEAGDSLASINGSRQYLVATLRPWWPSDGAQIDRFLCHEWLERLLAALERFRVRMKLLYWIDDAMNEGRIDEAAEHEHVWDELAKLFDEADGTLGRESMTGRQFREVIESGLADFTLGLVPSTLDQVLVSSIERSRHPPIRAAFVLGFCEGQFPARILDDDIFGEDDRRRLQSSGVTLNLDRSQKLLDERMLAYIAFTRPSELLWVSYPGADETGKPLSPSPYLPPLKSASGAVPIAATDRLRTDAAWPESAADISSVTALTSCIVDRIRGWCEGRLSPSEAADWHAIYNWSRSCGSVRGFVQAALQSLKKPQEAKLTPGAREAIWRRPYRTSVTALETYAECPFKHFAGQGLRLEPRPIHELSRLDLGRIYHEVLEQFVAELSDAGLTLRDVSSDDIARSLSRLFEHVVPQYAETVRIDENKIQGTVARGERELLAAKEGERFSLGQASLKPIATEQVFGMSGDNPLPALVLKTIQGESVELRGKMDRIDLLRSGNNTLAVVFDYKRSLGRSLKLDEAFHGLSLQLLAYLLVIKDHGEKLGVGRLIPGAAFYLPLLAGLKKVDHPSDVESGDELPLSPYRPRGVFDFDWIDALDPTSSTGWSKSLQVFRSRDGGLAHINSIDAVPSGKLSLLLNHVRSRMAELATRWIDGDISVSPVMLGTWTPCETCQYKSVCRIEHATRHVRRLEPMSRSDVLEKVGSGNE